MSNSMTDGVLKNAILENHHARTSIFKDPFAVNIHKNASMRSNAGKKFYKCQLCQNSFTTGSHLKAHLRIHTGEKPYLCQVCKKSFTQGGDLKVHMRIHTGERPYQCQLCQKSFSTNSHLTRHLKTHTEEKPCTCQICQKSFTKGGDLKVHMRTHSREYSFICEICKRGFIRLECLKKHRSSHSNVRQHTHDKPYREISSSTKQTGILPQGVELVKMESIGDLPVQFITLDLRGVDVIDRPNDQLSWNMPSDSNEATSPLRAKSPEDAKPYQARRFGCGMCNEMLEIEKEFLEHCSSHRLSPPDDFFLHMC